MTRATTVDEVVAVLIDRIGSGALPAGSKLPSCRALADELGSNPTTVNRAIARLADTGVVRTERRRGSFVAASTPVTAAVALQIRPLLEQVAERARMAGVTRQQLSALFEEIVDESVGQPRVAFVECNATDLREMADVVERSTGLTFERVLLENITKKTALRFDAIATPIFHLSDVYARIGDLDRVIELNFAPSASVLRQLASIDPDLVLGVATPIPRGIERLTLLARQYFDGEVVGVLTGQGELDLSGIDVLLYTSATDLTPEELDQVPRRIKVTWDLDHSSGASFELRLRAILADSVSV